MAFVDYRRHDTDNAMVFNNGHQDNLWKGLMFGAINTEQINTRR